MIAERLAWVKPIPLDMAAFVFYGYVYRVGDRIGPIGAERGNTPVNPAYKQERLPNGKTVVFVLKWALPAEAVAADFSHIAIHVGIARTSVHDQFCRKIGRTLALGRAWTLPIRMERHRRATAASKKVIREPQTVQHEPNSFMFFTRISEHATYKPDGTLDAKLTAAKLKAWALAEGWL